MLANRKLGSRNIMRTSSFNAAGYTTQPQIMRSGGIISFNFSIGTFHRFHSVLTKINIFLREIIEPCVVLFYLGKIVHSDSNGFSRFGNKENISDDSDKSSFYHQDVARGDKESSSMSHDIINKNTIQSQTELGVLDIEEAKNSGNG